MYGSKATLEAIDNAQHDCVEHESSCWHLCQRRRLIYSPESPQPQSKVMNIYNIMFVLFH